MNRSLLMMANKCPIFFLKGKSGGLFFFTGINVAFHKTTKRSLFGTSSKVDSCRTLFLEQSSKVSICISGPYKFDSLEKTNAFNFSANFYSTENNPNRTLHEIIQAKRRDEEFSKRQMVDETNEYMEDLSTKENISAEEWSKLREMFLKTPQFNATEKNVETVIMKLMNRYQIFRFPRLYFNHLKSLSVDINPATLAMYVKYIYAFQEQCTEKDFLVAEEICSKLVESSPLLSLTAADNVICGFSVTKNWRKSLEIFNEMKNLEISKKTHAAVAEACFRNKEYETGWEIIDGFGQQCWQLPDSLTKSILLYSIDKYGASVRLLKFYEKYFDRPNIECANSILSTASKLSRGKIKPAFTRINDRGFCQNCKQRLVNNSVTEEEYEKLRNSFLNPVLIGRDIFLKSTPEELSSFQRVLKKFTPFDYVLDGLNIAFSATTAKCKNNKKILARNLISVVNFLAKQNKKLLVIGRKHMLNWPKPFMEEMNKKTYFFLAEDVTQDDTYLLYASLYSGINTNFVSRDLMRGYRHLLADPELESIFWRWQYQHQYLVVSINRNGGVEFQTPVPYRQDAHCLAEDDRLWHVPCFEEVQPYTPGHAKLCNKTWLCLPLNR